MFFQADDHLGVGIGFRARRGHDKKASPRAGGLPFISCLFIVSPSPRLAQALSPLLTFAGLACRRRVFFVRFLMKKTSLLIACLCWLGPLLSASAWGAPPVGMKSQGALGSALSSERVLAWIDAHKSQNIPMSIPQRITDALRLDVRLCPPPTLFERLARCEPYACFWARSTEPEREYVGEVFYEEVVVSGRAADKTSCLFADTKRRYTVPDKDLSAFAYLQAHLETETLELVENEAEEKLLLRQKIDGHVCDVLVFYARHLDVSNLQETDDAPAVGGVIEYLGKRYKHRDPEDASLKIVSTLSEARLAEDAPEACRTRRVLLPFELEKKKAAEFLPENASSFFDY